MAVRISKPPSQGNPPRQPTSEISGRDWDESLLSIRSAAILGASFLIAVVAGGLAFLTIGRFPADLAGAALAAGTAFAGAVRLLMAIIT
jgi:hypothetical protein